MSAVTIPKEQFDNLSPRERSVLRKLGIGPSKPRIPKKYKPLTVVLKSYTLEVEIHCSLCKSTYKEQYQMQPLKDKERNNYLNSHPLNILDYTRFKPDKSITASRLTCKKCLDILRKWEKVDLVTQLIEANKRLQGLI